MDFRRGRVDHYDYWRGVGLMGPKYIPGLENAQHRYDMEDDNDDEDNGSGDEPDEDAYKVGKDGNER